MQKTCDCAHHQASLASTPTFESWIPGWLSNVFVWHIIITFSLILCSYSQHVNLPSIQNLLLRLETITNRNLVPTRASVYPILIFLALLSIFFINRLMEIYYSICSSNRPKIKVRTKTQFISYHQRHVILSHYMISAWFANTYLLLQTHISSWHSIWRKVIEHLFFRPRHKTHSFKDTDEFYIPTHARPSSTNFALR